MNSTRLLCAIVFGGIAVPSHAEEVLDAVVLYKNICIASNGDLLKGEQLAITNGFSLDPSDLGRKTYTRGGASLSMPFVTFKPAGSGNRTAVDICEVFGSTDRMAEFDDYAQSRGLREIPSEEILGDFLDQNYVRAFVSNDCGTANSDTKCSFVEALGDPPVAGKFSGAFRFGTVSPNRMEEE
ncbi:hypothetical protein RFM23_18855 [Mesorhizobium abyssinicae]|uniref:DUF1176 domain-containing protein n=1 Tax=Mesorhizobium abyssinicae TaxID=1209958 RepID=A0ABU5AQU8_9HYPH|nr:hypothetical protein [Mesorhizobium abyssinicae]MDX8539682.1 hypothetical protein [Mesorhizobium abyssinicae]